MRTTVALLGFAMLAATAAHAADEMPKMPAPEKEHAWLNRFKGEWESEVEIYEQPGMPAMKTKGTETVRPVGGFWIIAENKGSFFNMPFTGVQVLGYDTQKKKYVGSWVDSMNGHMWRHEGTVDASGNTLTLDSEGPCPKKPGTLSKFRDVTEFKTDDHRVMTASVEEDGKWVKMMQINFRRKK